MTRRKIAYWVIPPDAEFVAHMEDVLETYEKDYDPACPVVCMDEQPVQLIGETRVPIPATTEHPERVDYEYKGKGTASIFLFAEPLSGFRRATARPRRTKHDWAEEVAHLLDTRYAGVARITLVCDNLNTHTEGAFYEAFRPERAREDVRRIEFVYTPKPGSWLNVAECELSDPPVSRRPSHRRPRDAAIGNRRLVRPREREATSGRLAIHGRQGQGQVEAALPEKIVWTEH